MTAEVPAKYETNTNAPWIIVNPKAGAGRALQAGRALAALLPAATLMETNGPRDASKIARRAQVSSVPLVVAVGGDGTIQECVTGLCLDDSGEPAGGKTQLAILPAGTGGDFKRTHGFNDSVNQAATRILQPQPQRIDVGLIRYTHKGLSRVTACANVTSFGLGGLTDQFVEAGPKWIGGRGAFFLAALRASLVHQTLPIELKLDGKVLETRAYSNVAICLGRYFGGGMQIAPDADPSDGLFDVITIETSRLQTVALTASIYRGKHLLQTGVEHHRCSYLEARTTRPGESLIDVDGEQLGRLPLSAQTLPAALQLLT